MIDKLLTLRNWIVFLSAYFGVVFLVFCAICIKDMFTLMFEWTRDYVDLPLKNPATAKTKPRNRQQAFASENKLK
ncbi:hypothetical protein HUJ04_002320 [Dendroctonus ponderosae]|nr:hypothetical protein HUJ04_002320 [Dendroctonus ponderosae]KAH1024794.1 hypothetical protein HUJ05_004228 [Dendroctonus ponderosae]